VRTLCSSVLLFEAIVLGLAIPVALALSDVDTGLVVGIGVALVVACFLAAGLLGRGSAGLAIGWVVQVCAILAGFVIPVMFFLGGLFALLWFYAIHLGRKGDAATAAHQAEQAAWEAAHPEEA
jgi:hypothetical protein